MKISLARRGLIYLLFLSIFGKIVEIDANNAQLYSLGYADIVQQLVPALGLTPPAAKPKGEREGKKINLAKVALMSEYEQFTTVFDLFDKATSYCDATVSPLPVLMHDLNVFCFSTKDTSQRQNSLFSKLSGEVTTVLGQASLAYLIAHPISDVNELKARQAVIKTFVEYSESSEIRAACEKALANFKQQEPAFLTCYKNPTKGEKAHLNRLFFTMPLFNRLNGNEWILGATARLGDISVTNPIIFFTLVGAAGLYMDSRMMHRAAQRNNPTAGSTHSAPSILKSLKDSFTGELKTLNIVKIVKDTNAEIALEDQRAATSLLEKNCVYAFQLLRATGFALGQYLWMGLNTKHQVDIHTIDAYIHNKLISCAEFVRTFDALMAQAQAHPGLQYLVTSWQATCTSKSAKFKKLLGMLRTNTFTGKPSFFSRLGRVRAAYTLFMETREEFGDMARFVGTCDAYLALAKLYIACADSRVPYSFVHFVEQDAPYIKATGFWNPMVARDKVVRNNLELGLSPVSAARVAVVTGSNSGGKSTIMVTGLTSMLLLAQTCGIAPAEVLVMTPFDYLATSLKVQDNIISGKSHFVAETEHAGTLIKTVKKLGSRKAFLAIDELFEGTVADVGESSLYSFIKALSGLDNLLVTVATQYQGKPTTLETETCGLCRNMKIDVIRNSDGTITRPYKLTDGISKVSVGDQLFQEAMARQ